MGVRNLPTQFSNGLAVTKEMAVGLEGGILVIAATYATWNRHPILTNFPDAFYRPGLRIEYNTNGTLVDTPQEAAKKHIVHVTISDDRHEDVKIQVNRWFKSPGNEYINGLISMRPLLRQDGHCGNFNGQKDDDEGKQVQGRIGPGIEPDQLLF